MYQQLQDLQGKMRGFQNPQQQSSGMDNPYQRFIQPGARLPEMRPQQAQYAGPMTQDMYSTLGARQLQPQGGFAPQMRQQGQAGFGQLMGGPMGGLLNRFRQGPGPGQFGYGDGDYGAAPQMNQQQQQMLRDRMSQLQPPRGMTMDMPQRYGRQPVPPPNPYQMYGGFGNLGQQQAAPSDLFRI